MYIPSRYQLFINNFGVHNFALFKLSYRQTYYSSSGCIFHYNTVCEAVFLSHKIVIDANLFIIFSVGDSMVTLTR